MATRRHFLKVGLAGAAALFAARLLQAAHAAPARRALDPASERVVRALVPVVLAGALPGPGAPRAAAIARVVDAFDRALAALDAADRDDVSRLLGLLAFAPSRAALTGIWGALEDAPAAELARFLARWRSSRFDLLRAGYLALTQLVQASWYDDPAAWPAIGYPGPPSLDAGPAS